MKTKFLVLALFLGLVSLAFTKSHGESEAKEISTTQVEAKACIAPPYDRNCNGIPDWEE